MVVAVYVCRQNLFVMSVLVSVLSQLWSLLPVQCYLNFVILICEMVLLTLLDSLITAVLRAGFSAHKHADLGYTH